MSKDYEKEIDRAFANYAQRRETLGKLANYPHDVEGDPDRSKSRVEIYNGRPHVIIMSTEGGCVAFYTIRKNGRLRFIPDGPARMMDIDGQRKLKTLIGRSVVKVGR